GRACSLDGVPGVPEDRSSDNSTTCGYSSDPPPYGAPPVPGASALTAGLFFGPPTPTTFPALAIHGHRGKLLLHFPFAAADRLFIQTADERPLSLARTFCFFP